MVFFKDKSFSQKQQQQTKNLSFLSGGCCSFNKLLFILLPVVLFFHEFVFIPKSVKNHHLMEKDQQQQQQQFRQPRKLFIDLGANCGNTYYRMKDSLAPSSTETLNTPADWEVYLFECNPQMIHWFLNDLIKNETGVHKHLELIPKAASTSDGEITFYLTLGQDTIESMPNTECDPKSLYNPSGASTIYGNAERAGTNITDQLLTFYNGINPYNYNPMILYI